MAAPDSTERDLPRVPLPHLETSCSRFLAWCAPLLSDEELTETRAAVARFVAPDSPAHRVQEALESFDADPGTASWLDDFWRSRYLGRRDRIALNANFFFLFRDLPGLDPRTARDPQLSVAAALTAGALAYQRAFAEGRVPATTQRGVPLSMEGNRHLFSTTRIPGIEIDSVRTPFSEQWPGPSRERHVVVLRHGAAYRLDVVGPDGVPHTLDEIEAGLAAVRDAAPERGPAVGHLTTMARADWARARERLAARDRASLDVIERALFCVCLDDVAPTSHDAACQQLLVGDSGNRWYDKAVSLVVFGNGLAGVNGEHCCLDGTNVIELIDSLYEAPAADLSAASGARPQGEPAVAELPWHLDDELVRQIDAAGRDFAAYGEGNAMMLRAYDGFGADLAKRLGISPDAFVQMAIQLAHRRAKGFTGATYESVATRRFRHGRTEAMRVVTPEVVDFVDAMSDPAVSVDARRAALQAAASAHVARAKACQAGEAPEQHLWELQLLAARRGLDLPQELYRSPGWRILRDDYLSTSAVPSGNILAFGFGATSEHCIGVAYLLLPDRFSVYLATPRSVGGQMELFADALATALADIEELLA